MKLLLHEADTTTPRFDAAIFDFDETIIDLEPQHTGASAAVAHALGSDYEQLPEALRKRSGIRILDELEDMRAFFGWTAPIDEMLAIRQRYFMDACRNAELQLMPGVAHVIHELRDAGLTLAVTSSAVRDAIDMLLRRFGLRDAFALIVDGGDVTHAKPDPEAYLVTAARLGVAPDRCVVFEDSHVGALAAKRAGMTCIAVRNPRAHQWQDLSAADVEIGSFEELSVVPSGRSAPRRAG